MHEKLISLGGLTLSGRALPFSQAVLVWHRENLGVSWSGTVRLGTAKALPDAGEEAALEAHSLDGRRIEARVFVAAPEYGSVR